MNQETIYVTGHKHPDTDSVAAAVGYAFYKRCSGVKAVPCRLGQLNAESKYLLNRFGFEEPMFLEDARVKLGEIELDQPVVMHPDDTIFEMIGEMRRTSQKTCCVVDSDNRVLGVVTFNDAAVVAMGDTADNRTHLAEVSTENIAT
ncbi:MAG: CBS domain-containing protein, partial [Lachnospiraceae bacterium]|nr:CBS domain-containing protein [Lachnospiraceae bacterium]